MRAARKLLLKCGKRKEEPKASVRDEPRKENYALEFESDISGVDIPTLEYDGSFPITLEGLGCAKGLCD